MRRYLGTVTAGLLALTGCPTDDPEEYIYAVLEKVSGTSDDFSFTTQCFP
jgi:hypothetical protein